VSNTTSASAIQGYLNTAQTLAALTGNSGTTTPTQSISGLVSGINTTSIISALMQQASQPQQALKTQLTSVNNQLTDWSGLSQDATQLQSAADVLNQPSGWSFYQADSSSSAVSATVGSGAVGGSLTFTVNQLAQAASVISNGTVSSTNAQVTTASSLLLAQGASAIGLGNLTGNLALGNHTISVTTAATGAAVSSTGALAPSTTITAGSNDTLTYTLDGTSGSLTLAPGANLSPSQLAAEITAGSNGSLTASVSSSGALTIATTTQGSSQTLSITGGSALTALGLSAGQSGTGQDGVVSIDGTTTTLSTVTPGGSVTLNTPGGGTLTATVTGPLRAGSITADQVSVGNGSLQSVESAINSSGLGMTASTVQVGSSQYRLEITSNTTGAASDINLSSTALDAVGGTSVLTAGSDAQLTVGTGPGAFQVSSATNSVTGLMPGVTLQLNGTTAGQPVTVSLAADASAAAAQVSTLVTAANAMIKDLQTAMTLPAKSSTTTSSTSTQAQALEGILLGDPTANTLIDSLLGSVSSQGNPSGEGSAGAVGITMNTDGTLSFNQSAFEAAYTANPSAVAATFTQGGSSTAAGISVYQGSDATQSGSYAVDITQAATQASVTGSQVSGGAITGPETITLTGSGNTASYAATSGETLAAIAAGINAATATAGVGVEASVANGALTLTSTAYGSGGDFQVSSTAAGTGSSGLVATANTPVSATGLDVAGTIDGKAATGAGQLLIGALNSPAQGLLLQVTASAAQVGPGGLSSTVTYSPGIAAALANAAYNAVNPVSGTIVSATNGLQTQASDLQTQIANWNPILAQKEQTLQQEYTAMETSLASLDNTKSQLGQSFTSSSTPPGG
jgi:flagellar hook-associated protein 2